MVRDKVLRWINESEGYILEEVLKLLRMPSISGTGEGIEETSSYLKEWIREHLGCKVSLLKYGGHPIIYGSLNVGADKTLIFYNMYDVQPPEPLNAWIAPPFEAKIIDDKIVARGAYNTKGALMSTLLGIEAYIKSGIDPPVNIIFVLEGEEELGSPSMPKFVTDKRNDLKRADGAFFTIPSELVPGRPRLVLGNKGIVFLELICKVSKYDVHSSLGRGLYNPVVILSKVINELIDPLSGPKIPWLEEKTVSPTPEDLKYLDDIIESSPAEKIIEMYGIERTRLKDLDHYIATYFKSNVNVDGIVSGYMGPGTKTIIPSEARARLDFRLVPNIEPEDVINGLKDLLKNLGLEKFIEIQIHDAYTWSKTDPNSRIVKAAKKSYENMKLKPCVIPILPGSAPSYLFTRELGIPLISTAPGQGGRAHAPNEYITIDTPVKISKFTVLLLDNFS